MVLINKVIYTDTVITILITNIIITPQHMIINNTSVIFIKYKMKPELIEEVDQLYKTSPWVIPTQNVSYHPHSQSINSDGLKANNKIYLNNTTNYKLTFPYVKRKVTVSKNPILTKISINTKRRKCPELPLDKTNVGFVAIMLIASDNKFCELKNKS